MLMPKRTKYRRPHRVPHDKGFAKSPGVVHFGEYGLMAVESGWITNRQIEAARIAMTRYMKRQGQVWINIFPHLAKTAKPLEVRMGSGKGSPEGWVAVVKKGSIPLRIFRILDLRFKDNETKITPNFKNKYKKTSRPWMKKWSKSLKNLCNLKV